MHQLFKLACKCLLLTALLATAADAAAQISVNPAPGQVAELSYFRLTFDGSWALGTNRSGKFKVTGPEGVAIPTIYSGSEQTYYAVYFADDAVINTPGHYTLTVPAGKFEVNGKDVPETVFEYDVVNDGDTSLPAYTLTPAEGIYKTISGGFRLTFDTEKEISVVTEGVTLFGGETIYDLAISVDNEAHAINIIPGTEEKPIVLQEAADYNLIFPANSIQVGGVHNHRSLVFTYTVTGDVEWGWTGKYSANPADGSEVVELSSVVLTFDGAGVVKVSDSAKPGEFPVLYDANGREVCGATGYSNGSNLQISLLRTITAGGKYRLVIPARFVKVEGRYPEADIVLNYTIADNGTKLDYTYELTPADGSVIGANETVTIAFSADGLAEVTYDSYAWGDNFPHFTNTINAYNPPLQILAGTDGFTFIHDWPFETSGTYTLVIPAGFFTLLDADGNETQVGNITADYIVAFSAIDGVTVTPAETRIYDLKGVRVDQPKAGAVYIIDGKKTIKKQ